MSTYRNVVALEIEALNAYAKHHYEDAILAHGRAVAVAQIPHQPRLLGVLFNRLGQALEANDDFQDTVTAYEAGFTALTTASKVDVEQVLVSMRVIDKRFYWFNHMSTPESYSETIASDLETAAADPALPVKLLLNSANAYMYQSDEPAALHAYEHALGLPEILHAPELYIQALAHISKIRCRRGETAAAEVALNKALDLLDEQPDPSDRRHALTDLASIYNERGQTLRAIMTYRQALGLHLQSQDVISAGLVRGELVRLSQKQRRQVRL